MYKRRWSYLIHDAIYIWAMPNANNTIWTPAQTFLDLIECSIVISGLGSAYILWNITSAFTKKVSVFWNCSLAFIAYVLTEAAWFLSQNVS